MTDRQEQWRRVSAMAGLDEDGGILPPPPNSKIDQSPNPYWRNALYSSGECNTYDLTAPPSEVLPRPSR